jgi:hypothetical protein
MKFFVVLAFVLVHTVSFVAASEESSTENGFFDKSKIEKGAAAAKGGLKKLWKDGGSRREKVVKWVDEVDKEKVKDWGNKAVNAGKKVNFKNVFKKKKNETVVEHETSETVDESKDKKSIAFPPRISHVAAIIAIFAMML